MNLTMLKRSRISKLSKGLLFAAALFYFSYHMISGDKGVMAMIQLQQRVNTSHAELQTVEMDKIQLQHRVNMMYSDSMDKDLADEQARRLLGFAGEDEIVLLGY